MAKTLPSQWRGPGFDPWSGNKIPHATTKTWCSQIDKYFFKRQRERERHWEKTVICRPRRDTGIDPSLPVY